MSRYERAPCMLVVPIDVRVFMDVPANTTAESSTIDVRLCAGDRLDAVVSRLVLHQHPRLLPAHLRGQLHDALSAAIDVRLEARDAAMQQKIDAMSEDQKDRCVDRLARRYRATCLRFADRTQETPYAEAFAALITSGGASQVDGRGFDIVLAMERQFQLELTRLLEECLREEEQCRRRHNAELQIDPDTCAEELQLLQVTNESRISEIKSRQRVLFRERVLQLYALLSQGKTYDELDWLQQVLSFESVETVKEGKVIDNGAATSQTAEAISVEESSPPPASDPPAVTSIIEMGFSAEQARAALSLCDGNVDLAVMALLETPERVNAAVTKDQGRPNPRISSRDAAKVASGSSSPSTNRAWSPMGFIEQKLAGNPKTKDNLKRIGSWIDRAKSQIEELIESDESPVSETSDALIPSPEFATVSIFGHLAESFTICMGSQVRYTQNLRLMVSHIHDLYSGPRDVDAGAVRAQSLATLCSNNLTAVVVLVTPDEWSSYWSGASANRDLFRLCRRNTEFLFEEVEQQFFTTCTDSARVSISFEHVKEGDVFVTKHSNLPLVHVIFHLVVGSDSLQVEVNQRSPVMAGLRNILLTCFRANIKQVSIPLLLTRGTELSPTIRRTNSKNNLLSKTALSAVFSGISVEDTATGTDVSDKTILPLIYKRSEAVLKSVKGFLLECSRSYGRRGGAQALSSAADDTSFGMENTSTVQFVIPPHATAETVFHTLKDMIKEIFRAA